MFRTALTALHNNENSERQQKIGKDGERLFAVVFPKAKEGEPTLRKRYPAATYSKVDHVVC